MLDQRNTKRLIQLRAFTVVLFYTPLSIHAQRPSANKLDTTRKINISPPDLESSIKCNIINKVMGVKPHKLQILTRFFYIASQHLVCFYLVLIRKHTFQLCVLFLRHFLRHLKYYTSLHIHLVHPLFHFFSCKKAGMSEKMCPFGTN